MFFIELKKMTVELLLALFPLISYGLFIIALGILILINIFFKKK